MEQDAKVQKSGTDVEHLRKRLSSVYCSSASFTDAMGTLCKKARDGVVGVLAASPTREGTVEEFDDVEDPVSWEDRMLGVDEDGNMEAEETDAMCGQTSIRSTSLESLGCSQGRRWL